MLGQGSEIDHIETLFNQDFSCPLTKTHPVLQTKNTKQTNCNIIWTICFYFFGFSVLNSRTSVPTVNFGCPWPSPGFQFPGTGINIRKVCLMSCHSVRHSSKSSIQDWQPPENVNMTALYKDFSLSPQQPGMPKMLYFSNFLLNCFIPKLSNLEYKLVPIYRTLLIFRLSQCFLQRDTSSFESIESSERFGQ